MDADGVETNLESTLTGMMLLGFCLVTAVLNLICNPSTLGVCLQELTHFWILFEFVYSLFEFFEFYSFFEFDSSLS